MSVSVTFSNKILLIQNMFKIVTDNEFTGGHCIEGENGCGPKPDLDSKCHTSVLIVSTGEGSEDSG